MKERDVESFIFNSSPRKKRSQPDLGDKNKDVRRSISHRSVFSKEGNASKTGSRANHEPSKLSTNKTGADIHTSSVQTTHNFTRSSIKKCSVNDSNAKNSNWNSEQETKAFKKSSRLTTSIEMASVEHHIFNLAREIFEIDDLSLIRRKFVNIMHGFINIASKGSAYNYLNNVLGHMIESDKIADTAALLKEYFWPNGQWDDNLPQLIRPM